MNRCAHSSPPWRPNYGPRLRSLVGLLERLIGVSISGGAIVAIRARLAACLREPMEEALREARLQPVVYMDETGAPTGNADGGIPDGLRGWLWVLMTLKLSVFSQDLSRSSAAVPGVNYVGGRVDSCELFPI